MASAQGSYRIMLYRDGDFWISANANLTRSYIRFIPQCVVLHELPISVDEPSITGFDIKFWDLEAKDWLDMKFELYEFFLPSFWTDLRSHTEDPSSDWPLVGPLSFPMPPGSEGFPVDREFLDHFQIPTPVLCLLHVWEDCRKRSSGHTMTKIEFCRWLLRICCLVHDLIAAPIIEDGHWGTRRNSIHSIIGSPYGFDFAGYTHPDWSSDGRILQKEAQEYRQIDACLALNELSVVSGRDGDPLWKFIHIFTTSMADALLSRNMILKCTYCGGYMLFRQGKTKCSQSKDGRDCGGAERNKRKYYRNKRG